MDGSRFDDLTKLLGAQRSRRGVLGALAGAALASLGLRDVDAAGCGQAGQRCGAKGCCGGTTCLNGTCCANALVCGSACCPSGYQCQNGACVRSGNSGGTTGGCPSGQASCSGNCVAIASDVNNCGACGHACPAATDPCHIAVCTNGTCGVAPGNDGASCNDGNKCTQTDTCQGGSCVGSNPVVCTALDQCHLAGACDPGTGVCSNPLAPLYTFCNTGQPCTGQGLCQADGSCSGPPIVCPPPPPCFGAVSCDQSTGLCPNSPYLGDGTPCSGGVCFNQACCAPEDPSITCANGACGTKTNNCGQSVQCLHLANESCQQDTDCCSGVCVDSICQAGLVATGGACDSNGDCTSHNCCNGTCVDTSSDIGNCGGCGLACSNNHVDASVCSSGVCGGYCATGWGDCNGNLQSDGCETNIFSDPDNCGACGASCPTAGAATRTCSFGFCEITCAAGFANCTNTTAISTEGCPVNLNTDNSNCGACSNACASDQYCSAGTCVAQLATGSACTASGQCVGGLCCGGICVDMSTDSNNCGGCGVQCPSAQTCVNGACACPAGETYCFGNCVNLLTDFNNCGFCTLYCGTNETCVNGTCDCLPPLSYCLLGASPHVYYACIDVTSDSNNCGACGNVCGSDEACMNGQCICQAQSCCPAGQTYCAATLNGAPAGCTDVSTDPDNCGGCSNVGGGALGGSICGLLNNDTACCGGTCIDPLNDSRNCGTCGHTCVAGGVYTGACQLGVCVETDCPAPYANCDGNPANGCETNLSSDPNNCGVCGNVCPGQSGGAVCVNGLCCVGSGGTCGAGGLGCCNGNRCDALGGGIGLIC